MADGYTRINLADVADAAADNGFGDRWEARVAREELGAEQTGLTHFRLDLRPLDAVRVAPAVARAFEAGPEGLEFIAFGPHYDADGEPVEDSWVK